MREGGVAEEGMLSLGDTACVTTKLQSVWQEKEKQLGAKLRREAFLL